MMYLGWYSRPDCKRELKQVVPPGESCANINWFWLIGGAILVGGLVKRDKA